MISTGKFLEPNWISYPRGCGRRRPPFRSEQAGRSQRASRVALRRPFGPYGASLHRSRCHIFSFRSLGWTTFSSRNRAMTSPKKYFPSSSTSCHDDSAVKCTHNGGARTSNLPLNSLANLYIHVYRTDAISYTICCSERKCAYGAIKCCIPFERARNAGFSRDIR